MLGASVYPRRYACARAAVILMLVCLGNAPSVADVRAPELIHVPAGSFITGSDRAERAYAYQLDEQGYGGGGTGRAHLEEALRLTQTLPFTVFEQTLPLKTPQ